MATVTAANSFLQRIFGALALDPVIYEEVEQDANATTQACAVVVLSSLAAGVGARGVHGNTPSGIAIISIAALLLWAAWALVTFEIGAQILPERKTIVDLGQMLRTIGFASAPGLMFVFGIMPQATIPVFAVASVWMLCAMIVAVRQALDYQSTAR